MKKMCKRNIWICFDEKFNVEGVYRMQIYGKGIINLIYNWYTMN